MKIGWPVRPSSCPTTDMYLFTRSLLHSRVLIQTCLHPPRRFPDRHFYAIHLVGTISRLPMKLPDQFSWYIQQRTTFPHWMLIDTQPQRPVLNSLPKFRLHFAQLSIISSMLLKLVSLQTLPNINLRYLQNVVFQWKSQLQSKQNYNLIYY